MVFAHSRWGNAALLLVLIELLDIPQSLILRSFLSTGDCMSDINSYTYVYTRTYCRVYYSISIKDLLCQPNALGLLKV